ncbi:Peptidase, M23/M37 family [hydrothermal vent metagenome]|uniref:Peptidase, M23/M37 family n=1 Tax=hydrothermal vent metagenome TaxID=652676 RepID=A0A3B0WC34_9ZZZZ
MQNKPIQKHVWKFTSITFIVVVFLSLFFSANANTPFEPTRTHLPLPELNQEKINANESNNQAQESWEELEVTIQKNGSLGAALDRLKISPATTHAIGRLKNSQHLTNLRSGDKLRVWIDKDHTLQKILYPKSQTLSYELIKTETGYHLIEKKAPIEVRTETASGTINGSFYLAAKRSGLSAKSIMNLSDVFAWDVDFSREVQSGDTFKVIYETKYLNGKYIGDGNILAAQISSNNQKQTHNAFIARDNENKVIGYYDENGKNLKKAFLRSPVDYVRITSKYNPKRFHPVLKRTRPHRGVDYGGPKGTPIRATGKGKIVFRGTSKGYGRYVKIKHAGKYTTLYAHFSKFGQFKKGSYVKQGDIIGYMGKTGLVTGVHLHYEFRVNNKHVDPLKVKFPDAKPLAKKYRTEFKKTASFLLTQLKRLDNSIQIALNFE